MIRVEIETSGGCLKRMSVRGHDTAVRQGVSLPCGIVSALARTAARFFEGESEVQLSGDAPEPGELWLVIKAIPEQKKLRVQGITDFLLTGFRDVEKDFPEIVELNVKRR